MDVEKDPLAAASASLKLCFSSAFADFQIPRDQRHGWLYGWGHRARRILLRTPNSVFGLVLLALSQVSATCSRRAAGIWCRCRTWSGPRRKWFKAWVARQSKNRKRYAASGKSYSLFFGVSAELHSSPSPFRVLQDISFYEDLRRLKAPASSSDVGGEGGGCAKNPWSTSLLWRLFF